MLKLKNYPSTLTCCTFTHSYCGIVYEDGA